MAATTTGSRLLHRRIQTIFASLALGFLVVQNLRQFRQYFQQQTFLASRSSSTTSMQRQLPQDRVLDSSALAFVHENDSVNDILDAYWSRSRDGMAAASEPANTITAATEENEDTSIRSWGCNVTDTPFIFVHIGKAGGGGVRRRIAVGAINFTRGAHNWAKSHLDQHSYPVMRRDGTMVDAKFCNSARSHHQRNRTITTYEGNQVCTAQTPLGKMLACPEIFRDQPGCVFHPNEAASAHLVYVGHNSLGSEVHWLPVPYLQDWWRKSGSSLMMYGGKLQQHTEHVPLWRDWLSGGLNNTGSQNQEDNLQHTEHMMMHSLLQRLDGQHPWCDDLRRPIQVKWKAGYAYQECAQTKLEGPVDAFATRLLLGGDGTSFAHPKRDDPVARGRAFAQIYSSLPVVRVTLLREPMSWLVSRFAWHGLPKKFKITCDDIAHATAPTDKFATTGLGWVNHFSLVYIMNICGEDCMVRYLTHGNVTLTELEAQASHNLRHSLAVVGLLHETDTFYDMITARVQYMDLSDNSTEGQGQHKSGKSDYCKERFEEADFQAELMAASPELATLMRLYEVGVKVNAFQKQELEQCTGRPLVVS